MRRLPADDLAQIQMAHDQQHRNHRHAHRNFIRNHLRAGTDAAEKRVFGIGRIARQHDAVNPHRNNAESVQNADIQIRDHHFLLPEVRSRTE